MNKKMNIIFITLCVIIFLSFLTNSMVNAKEEKNTVQIIELWLNLDYNKNPVLYDSTRIEIGLQSGYWGDPVTINIVDLTVKNSTHILQIYSNPSPIYLNRTNQGFHDEVYIQFNKTETWNITLFVETATGDPFYEYGQFEVSPFRLRLVDMYDTYVNNPTEFNIQVDYKDTIPNKNIAIEILLDDSMVNYPGTEGTNVSIYNSLHTFTVAPGTYFNSFNYSFDSTGIYKLWLNVTDLGTKQQWFTWNHIYPQWINVTLNYDYQLFVGNTTKIEFEIYSYHPFTIEIDVLLTIRCDKHYDDYEMYSDAWSNIQLNPTTPRFNNSVIWTFSEHGDYWVDLEVNDESNNEGVYDTDSINVYNEVDLRIYQPTEIWVGEEYWADLDIRYFKSNPVTADIEFFIDDGTSTTSLRTETVIFDGNPQWPFDSDDWYGYNSTTINQKGYFDVWLQVNIQETGKTITEHCWFYVRGDDTALPVFRDISGLTNGETYSDRITITTNITDDQSEIYDVYLNVDNENFTEDFVFDTEIQYFKYKMYCHCYAVLELDTANIYDGKYEVTIEARDNKRKIVSETFSVRFENGNIYEPYDDDRISPGFEVLGLILTLIVVAGLVKRRK